MSFRSISYVPVTEHVMTDDWIAFGAAVWKYPARRDLETVIHMAVGGRRDNCCVVKMEKSRCSPYSVLLSFCMLVIGHTALMINGHVGPTQCGVVPIYLPDISIETGPFGPATRRIQPRSHDAGLSHGVDGQD